MLILLAVMVVLSCGLVLKVTLIIVHSSITALRSTVVLSICKAVLKVTVAVLNFIMLSLRITSPVLMVVPLIGMKVLMTVF